MHCGKFATSDGQSPNQSCSRSLSRWLVLTKLDNGCATLAGLPDIQLNRLQAVQNAGACLIFSARKYDHVSLVLRELHWLRVPERIAFPPFPLATLAYRCLHATAPCYLAVELRRVADIEARQRLRSASTDSLYIWATRRSTIGDRAFGIARLKQFATCSTVVCIASSVPMEFED